jgi:hypothetical protein
MEAQLGARFEQPSANSRRGGQWLSLALLACAPLLLTACGVSATTVTKPSTTSIASTCQRVADILSDGPDPAADPVGYALAQVLPLRQVKTTDKALLLDIGNLASAYQTVYKTNDKKGTEAAVNAAGKKLDSICPGAF